MSTTNTNNPTPTSQNFPQLPKFSAAQDADPPPDPALDLPDHQLAALRLILAGATDTAVAAAVGVSRRTIYTWRKHDDAFKAALAHHRQDLFDSAADRVRSLLSSSLDALEKQLKDPFILTSHRAAKTILSLSKLSNFIPPK